MHKSFMNIQEETVKFKALWHWQIFGQPT